MKRLLRITFGIIYLAAILFSLIVLVKSGASFFYLRSPIPPPSLSRNGLAFEYPLNVNTALYDPNTILVFEDQKSLAASWPDNVETEGNGVFALEDKAGQTTVLFSPTGLSDPATNGHTYLIYIRPYLVSSNMGGIFSLVLIVVLIAFLTTDLADPLKRKVLFGSPFGFVNFWVDLFDPPVLSTSARQTQSSPKSSKAAWTQSAVYLVLVAYFYVLMEWIFFVTKPSFMDVLTLVEKLKILLINGLGVALVSLFVLFVFFLLDRLLTPVFPAFRNFARHIPFAFLATCLCLILVDNFTYTVFKFGVVDSTTVVRLLYALGLIGVFIFILRKMAAFGKHSESQSSNRVYVITAAGLMGVSLILAVLTFQQENHPNTQTQQVNAAAQKPNIIFLSSDGVNANNLSVYGYDRNTTPFLTELAKTSLVSENNFTNSGQTLGSIASILTGKLPLATHVLYPPDTLQGKDQYEHLPGLLKTNGYRTLQVGIPYYVDANFTNFQDAFDIVNCAENSADDLAGFVASNGFNIEFYMLKTITGRITDRVSHLFFIKDMQNPFSSVTQSNMNFYDDQKRIGCLLHYLEDARQAGQPLFAQMHLMGTHGDRFFPISKVFSKDENQDHSWMTDFYDDAILDFDVEVKQIVQFLKDNGMYDNTILVVYTDHGQQYVTTNRIPLIIHFPNDQHTGLITNNTQIIDVPPTILQYMGIQKPDWMAGVSLLEKVDPLRLILGTKTNKTELVSGIKLLVEADLTPPFYQFSELTVTQCQNLFDINLEDLTMVERPIEKYVNPCPADRLDSAQSVREKVGKILTGLGYALPANW